MRSVKIVIGVVAVIFIVANTAQGYYQGHHGRGTWGLSSGTQPGTGLYFAPIYTRYSADKIIKADGEEANVIGDITVNAFTLFGWWVSPFKIAGADYGPMVMVPFKSNTVEFTSFNFDSSLGVGDAYVRPVNFGWHLKRADVMAGFGLYLPTGRYEPGATDNVGMGMWTLEFLAGTTVYFDAERKWHASALAFFEVNSKKKDSETKVGDIVSLEGGAGRSFLGGGINVGAAYYAQWKVSFDKIDAGPLGTVKALHKNRVYGLGPEVTFPIVVKKRLIALVTARYQWELGARSSLEGKMFNVYAAFPFFTGL